MCQVENLDAEEEMEDILISSRVLETIKAHVLGLRIQKTQITGSFTTVMVQAYNQIVSGMFFILNVLKVATKLNQDVIETKMVGIIVLLHIRILEVLLGLKNIGQDGTAVLEKSVQTIVGHMRLGRGKIPNPQRYARILLTFEILMKEYQD
jgi:hypothetical protein